MHFIFNWPMTLFSVGFLTIFVYLGFWQLSRYEEKLVLIADQQALATSPWQAPDDEMVTGTPIQLHGHYDPESLFLLDNRILKGVVGFEVLNVFFEESTAKRVLINRGFVPMGRDREDKPKIPALVESKFLYGHVYHPSAPFLAGHPQATAGPIVQTQQPQVLVANQLAYPWVVRLRESDLNALPRNWPVTTILPEKHRAYAIQWFLMAAAIAIAYSCFCIRRRVVSSV
ncbi:MAG: SURF1 family protein [Pseudomonadales bacterium]|nr:SURF1 family protein [Pseudomonadales bacterium]